MEDAKVYMLKEHYINEIMTIYGIKGIKRFNYENTEATTEDLQLEFTNVWNFLICIRNGIFVYRKQNYR